MRDSSGRSVTTGKVRRSRLAALALVALLFGGLLSVSPATPSEPAGAWPLSATVTLKGRAICGSRPATWVYVSASNGERGWATQPGGNYSRTFTRVPTSTMTVKVT